VIAVRNPGTEEVCADAALLVEPNGLAAALARAEREPALLEQLSARGRERAGRFSWERCAADHERAYTLALE
jgi:glycosyltransferase involved in cell wall biosynthesis